MWRRGRGRGRNNAQPAAIRSGARSAAELGHQEQRRAEIERSPEYSGAPQLGLIKASHAYSRGASGQGEKILVVDSGIQADHLEFSGAGKTVTQGNFRPEDCTPSDCYTPSGDQLSHGSAVAGMAAGGRDGMSPMHGVAYGADIHVAYLRTRSSGGFSSAAADLPAAFGTDVYEPVNPLSAWFLLDSIVSNALRIASEENADVINLSLGVAGAISSYERKVIVDLFYTLVDDPGWLMVQDGVDPADKKIFVWAAGNAGNDFLDTEMKVTAEAGSPELFAGLGAYIPDPELHDNVLAVASVDAHDGEISHFSNHCGIAKSFCLAAPGGGGIIVPDIEGSCPDVNECYRRAIGTSFAAPAVSGALVLLRQYFRGQIGNTELVERLLATADKTGIYADEDIYGQGLLDLDRATWAVGTLSMALSSSVDGEAAAFGGTSMRTDGFASGDALERAFAGKELVAFDELGAPFFFRLDALADSTSDSNPGDDVRRLMREENAADLALANGELRLETRQYGGEARISRFSYHRAFSEGGADYFLSLRGRPGHLFGPYRDGTIPAPVYGDRLLYSPPYLSFSAGGLGAGGSINLPGNARLSYGLFRGRPAFDDWDRLDGEANRSMMLELGLADDSLIFQAGRLREPSSVAGLSAHGAMGRFAGRTVFGGLVAQSRLGPNWTARASAYLGRSRPAKRAQGVVRQIGALTSSALAMGVEGREVLAPGDALAFTLDQPLRIERGSMLLSVPVGRTRYREVVRETFGADLEPSGRNLRLQAAYARASANGQLRFELGIERHAGHSADNGIGPYARMAWKRTF